MKHARKILVGILLLVPIIAAAQLTTNDSVVAQVPFRFMVANQYVPAGECILQKMDANGRTLVIRNVEANRSMFVLTSSSDGKTAAPAYAMVFHKYGTRYFLSGLRVADARTVYSVAESKEEAELRAQNVVGTEQIVLASLR
jgi:hypothetical protein